MSPSIDAMVARTVAELGRLDVIVNNAGVTRYAHIMDLTEADWDRIHRVNAKGVFFCLQRAAREMIKHQGGGGRIINIASISGRGYAGASNAAYAASKGAVIVADQDGGPATRPAQHQCQCDLPGGDAHRSRRAQRRRARRRARHHGRRTACRSRRRASRSAAPITPEDIAAMAVFLASPGARNITGQAYNVDGGLVPS